MTYRRSYNLRGMDISSPYNADRLWYSQDTVSVGPNAIRTRPRFPSLTPSSAGQHLTSQESLSRVGAFNHTQQMNIFDADTEAFLPAVDDVWWPASGVYDIADINVSPVSSTRVGDDTFFVTRVPAAQTTSSNVDTACYLLRWSGGSSSHVRSTSAGVASASVTASVTASSSSVTISGSLGADPTGSKIFFHDRDNHFYTVQSWNGSNTIVLTQPADFTDASTTFSIHAWSYLTTNNALDGASGITGRGDLGSPPFATDTLWTYGGSFQPTGLVYAWSAEGHQGRLFISNGNEVRYSGTEDDVTTRHGGVEYWDADSRFTVAPELGSRIEKMVSHNNDLLIFKDRGICVLRGTVANGQPDRLGARVDTISTHLRTQSVRHVIPTALGVVLVSTQGIYLVDGSGAQRIGDEVWSRIGSKLNGSVTTTLNHSLLMDDKLYLMYEQEGDNTANRYVYACWDTTTGEWTFRTFPKILAPGCSSQVEGSSGTITVSFPADTSGTKSICYSGGEMYGAASAGSSLNAAGSGSVLTNDSPEMVVVTAPFTGEGDGDVSGLYHARVRNIYTNSVVTTEDDTAVYSLNNFGAEYSFSVPNIVNLQTSAYKLVDTGEQQWYKHVVTSDSYGWGKGVAIYSKYDGSGTPQTLYLRGLCVEYDESRSIP